MKPTMCPPALGAAVDHTNLRSTPPLVHSDLSASLETAFVCAGRVAWDVETSGLDWRVHRMGTCQLHSDDGMSVIVQLDDRRPRRLSALLENTDVVKVFHHAPFDLRFMMSEWQARPTSIMCTKVASKLLFPRAANPEHSLQHLLESQLGVKIAKGPERVSDWLAEELSAQQLAYALQDVMHLLALLDVLIARLTVSGLDELYRQCCLFLPARASLELGGYPDVFAY
jgi:ribonuclease D